MFRLLALPVAVAAVLASAGCAMADRGDESAPSSPDASTTPPGAASPGASAPAATATDGVEPSAGQGTEEPLASESDASASSTPTALDGDPGVPGLPQQSGASVDDVLRLGAVASWAEQPGRIALSLPASSTCWAFAGEPLVESPTRIVVQIERPEPCDEPDGARTYAIAVPEGVDTSADLQLAVVGPEHRFTLTLPAG